jgi:hypothetical protein
VHDIQEFGGNVVHLRDQYFDPVLEVVIPHDRRDGRYQADGGSDQRLGDTGREETWGQPLTWDKNNRL